MSQERPFWLAWSQLQGVGPVLQKRLALHFGSLEAAWHAPLSALQQVEGIGPRVAEALGQQRRQGDPTASSLLDQPLITPADEAYPKILYEIPDPPPVLYYRGDIALLKACQQQPGIAIVGTRSPSDYGKRWTRRLTTALSQAGFVIISGLADGIDRVAHQSCLEAQGQTIAVLGTGVDVVYPHRNRDLHQAIATAGVLLSEHPAGTPPDRAHFPRRNRVIAGLSRAVLVTEAPRKSGALITAQLANDYGRDVYTLPGSLDNPRCYGCLDLVNQGAQLILTQETLIDALGGIPVDRPAAQLASPPLPPPDLAPHLQQVWQAVAPQAQSLDQIVQHLQGVPTGDILSALIQLELMGLVSQLPGMQYQRSSD